MKAKLGELFRCGIEKLRGNVCFRLFSSGWLKGGEISLDSRSRGNAVGWFFIYRCYSEKLET